MWAATRSRATLFGRRRTGGERRPRWSRTRRSGASPYRSTRVPHRHGPADRAPRCGRSSRACAACSRSRIVTTLPGTDQLEHQPYMWRVAATMRSVASSFFLLGVRGDEIQPSGCHSSPASVERSSSRSTLRTLSSRAVSTRCSAAASAAGVVLPGCSTVVDFNAPRPLPPAAAAHVASPPHSVASPHSRRWRSACGLARKLSLHGEQGLDLVEVWPGRAAVARHRHLRGRRVRGGRGKHRAQDHRAVEPRKARKRKGAIAAAQPRQHDRAVEETAQPRRRMELLDLVLDEYEAALVLKPRRHARLEAKEAAARAPTFVVRLVIVPRHRLA